ncbi:glycosyltransferase family 8 protein [Helicobacter acinonychis]|uniref:Lipopolysaccharide biosynthesis protein n=1 Tax=Helicobacter acinonychis (strain Sheeba) TaxID=382638 RepID=Q17VR5_HELAH|nr:glycosyltransferase family 8 protein [Helicobacter acinonychis]CAK00261.1 Lipopolysaccharide biosynthesis protein [Helicobacter acinonychis str. Sheeba]STP09986.1 lipopolysaccharide biosynthesis protein [Helicobacter acinonychis]
MQDSVIIPIVVAFDNNYCIPAGVSLYSMLANAKTERERVKLFYKIHCLVDGLSAENIEKLKETLAPFSAFSSVEFLEISTHNTPKENQEIKKNQTIKSDHYQNIDPIIANKIEELFTKLSNYSQKRFSKMIMCRLLLASLFPQYDKMIMFDVDTLFVGDISESFFIPLEAHYFGAVREKDLIAMNRNSAKDLYELRQRRAKSIGVANAFPNLEEAQILFDNYFNAGFLALNLKLWRKENLENQLIGFFILKNEKLLFNDQDALCFVCRGRILELPYPYNAHPSFLDTPSFPSIKEVCMLHFWGDKPWKIFSVFGAKKWHEVLMQTPFKDKYFNTPFLDHLFNHIQNKNNKLRTFNKALSFVDKRRSFAFLLPRLSSRLLIEFLLFKIKQKVKRLVKKMLKAFSMI